MSEEIKKNEKNELGKYAKVTELSEQELDQVAGGSTTAPSLAVNNEAMMRKAEEKKRIAV